MRTPSRLILAMKAPFSSSNVEIIFSRHFRKVSAGLKAIADGADCGAMIYTSMC
jgi:hypothetical protein